MMKKPLISKCTKCYKYFMFKVLCHQSKCQCLEVKKKNSVEYFSTNVLVKKKLLKCSFQQWFNSIQNETVA